MKCSFCMYMCMLVLTFNTILFGQAPSGTLSTSGSVACAVPCSCKWRITFRDEADPSISESSGGISQATSRSQHVANGRPFLFATARDYVTGTAELQAALSKGTMRVRLVHIDTCSMCSGEDQKAAIIAGWSAPEVYFSGRTESAGYYNVSCRIFADFSRLNGADSSVRFNESASSSGYSASVEVGVGMGSVVGAGVTITLPTSSDPINNRPHFGLFAQEQKFLTEEVLQLIGSVQSQLSADGWPGNQAYSQVRVNKADHNAGLLFLCVCNPSSGHSGAPAPVGSGTPGPVPLGGTTGRGTGGTTGAGSPSGEPGTPKPQRPKPVILDGPMGGEIGFDGTGQPALKPRSEAISNSEEQSSVNGGSQ